MIIFSKQFGNKKQGKRRASYVLEGLNLKWLFLGAGTLLKFRGRMLSQSETSILLAELRKLNAGVDDLNLAKTVIWLSDSCNTSRSTGGDVLQDAERHRHLHVDTVLRHSGLWNCGPGTHVPRTEQAPVRNSVGHRDQSIL